MRCRDICKIVSLGLGPILIILGACTKWAIVPVVVDNMVKSQLKLDPSNTETWEGWVTPPIIPYMKFTFFNVENTEEIKMGMKPRVKEVGDFAYKEVRRKENILSIYDEISYGSYIHYEYDAEASGPDGQDPNKEVTIINPVMAIVNALMAQLRQSLHFDNFDPFFPCSDIGKLCGLLPQISFDLVEMCPLIPDGEYALPCNLLGDEVGEMLCGLADEEGDVHIKVEDNNIIIQTDLGDLPLGACVDFVGGMGLSIEYEDGFFNIKNEQGDLVQAMECATLIEDMVDCEDPLHTWPTVEKLLLQPLMELVNCEVQSPTTTTASVETTTTSIDTTTTVQIDKDTSNTDLPTNPPTIPSPGHCDNIDYENVPRECFCDGLTMTDTPSKMIFTGAHSGILLALHHVLEHFSLTIKIPDFLMPGALENFPHNLVFKDIDLAQWVDKILDNMGMSMIDLKQGKFGFFRGPGGSNATKTWWKINNGKYQMELYNQVTEFNGGSKLPESWWQTFGPTPSAHKSGVSGICHDITGTDGLAFAPPISKEEDVWLFNDQLCRSIWLSFVDEVEVDGVTTYQFSPKPEVFNMSNPNNFCYVPIINKCAKPMPDLSEDAWDMSDCRDKSIYGIQAARDGLLSLQGCQGGPVLMSTPHFLDGDPLLSSSIDGINPDKEKHTTILNLEPTTGLPIIAHKRIQVSVPLIASEYFDAFNSVAENIFPVVWVDEGADIDEESMDLLKSMLVTPFLVVDILVGFVIGIGGLLIILAGGLQFFWKR